MSTAAPVTFDDLGLLNYADAWAAQEGAHAAVLAGGPGRVLLVEHPPVVTLGRRPGTERHLRVTSATLAAGGVDLVQSDRGGDVTVHGPGQLVAYPILRLADHGFTVSSYVHWLERVAIATLAAFGVVGRTDPAAVGVWVDDPALNRPAKACAIGVRIRRGVTLHGLALNVTTDLRLFDLIVPCGLHGRPVTSLRQLLGPAGPDLATAKAAFAERFAALLPSAEVTRAG